MVWSLLNSIKLIQFGMFETLIEMLFCGLQMAHDCYHCQNEQITKMSPLKVFPFPTQRDGQYYVGGVGGELYPAICPIACRPPDHQDWEFC